MNDIDDSSVVGIKAGFGEQVDFSYTDNPDNPQFQKFRVSSSKEEQLTENEQQLNKVFYMANASHELAIHCVDYLGNEYYKADFKNAYTTAQINMITSKMEEDIQLKRPRLDATQPKY